METDRCAKTLMSAKRVQITAALMLSATVPLSFTIAHVSWDSERKGFHVSKWTNVPRESSDVVLIKFAKTALVLFIVAVLKDSRKMEHYVKM